MKKNVLVVTHDAGGSEIIAAYVKKHRARAHFHVYTNGPGARVFRRVGVPFHRIANDRAAIRAVIRKHKDADYALLALKGWMTNIEWLAREEAMRVDMRTVVYLEDWRRYRERFGYPKKNWEKNLPAELWAGDQAALKLARTLYKDTKTSIRYVPNEYFKAVSLRVKKRRRATRAKDVLFLSSPLQDLEPIVEQLLEILSQKRGPRLLIRLHPADKKDRYRILLRRYRGKVISEISKHADPASDFARAKMIIGTRTVALALAAYCGLPTFSVLSPVKAPLPGVVHVKDFQAAFRRVKI